MWYDQRMKKYGTEPRLDQIPLSLPEFLVSFNKNMPKGFMLADAELMKKFKEMNPKLFPTDEWYLGIHRKKVMDWLPRNNRVS
ncbi:MAG: hypothetical protein US50_C0016G0018 [Candidatus Nomurabacteria bacterium GW2011_GWB1_37_5]|uniref:Uncharacterized protein n=1 Tax=Candidatus Nomurabacteria bacterium GW2011_GWB1_37_5 TaxID=1618742 RepID=A0A0G0GWK7_9BACT|nr:MAG: hypothetical protein US50_C0016G0018 [Candidatus Nomurabacteria bacterium GW2011_GWB1_37_5]